MSAHTSSQPAADRSPESVVAATELAAVRRLLHPDGAAAKRGGFSIIGPGGEVVPLPNAVVELIDRAATALARGAAITIVPVDRELTTQQAAGLLNVSRQYLVRLLDEGRLPSRRTGTHRRVRADDVMAFKLARDRQRADALSALAELSEDMGGYEELE